MVVCLTGGIASGKTMVSNQLGEIGFDVIDSDVISRQVVEKGSQGLLLLVKAFGDGILHKNGTLNRSQLKRLAFKSPDQVEILNNILHPLIFDSMNQAIKNSKQGCQILVIPLLTQQMVDMFDAARVLVVDVNESVQINRVIGRDHIELELVKKIIDAQPSRETRLNLATDVIVNNKSLESLKKSIFMVAGLYQSMDKNYFN